MTRKTYPACRSVSKLVFFWCGNHHNVKLNSASVMFNKKIRQLKLVINSKMPEFSLMILNPNDV